MKKLKLSTKIAILICSILFVIFSVLISISVITSSSTIQEVSFGEMEALTERSGAEVEKILSIAQSSSTSMANYMQTAYAKREAAGVYIGANTVQETEEISRTEENAADAEDAVTETENGASEENTGNPDLDRYIAEQKRESDLKNTSEIYPDLVLSEVNREIENFLLETAKNTVISNEDIAGVGVLFEPYSFSRQRESYSFYVSSAETGGG